MATLTVWKFDTASGADEASTVLASWPAARSSPSTTPRPSPGRRARRSPKTHQLQTPRRCRSTGRSFWGMLFGLIFFVPLLGAAIGAATGALPDPSGDVGIDDGFINKVRDQVTPGTSALFVMTSDAWWTRCGGPSRPPPPELIFTNLSDEQEAAIREVFAE